MKFFQAIFIGYLLLFGLISCTLSQSGSEVPFRVKLPEVATVRKSLFSDVAVIEIPKGSKTSYYRKLKKTWGEAGALRIKGFEGRPILMWNIQLYDPEAEEEYQATVRNRPEYEGKGNARAIPRQNEVFQYNLPPVLWHPPGGEQSMFRYDTQSSDKRMTIRCVVYCLDSFCGSEAQKVTVHQQISKMLESIRFTDESNR